MVSPSKKKKVERRPKTGPSPANSSTASGPRRNKATNSKPLSNRRFYFDVKNQAAVKKLSERINSLGGKLELFLVKEVDYVVTDRENFPLKKRSPLDQAPTPSPLPSFCSVSPATTDSPTDGLGNKKTRSRAEAMLERVKQQPQKTTGDVLDNALTWKIPIYPLSKFLAWLERITSKTNKESFKDQNSGVNSPPGRNIKVLTGSYLKIETGVRPEFKQFPAWPSLGLLHRPAPSASNQEKPEHKRHSAAKKDLTGLFKKDLNSNEPSQRMTRKVGRVKEASSAVGGGNGYCEICRVYYDQLDSHTSSAQHLKLVTDSAQYSQLDSIIQQNNLGSNNLRKSLRIAKSPPPFLPPEMGGKHSSGSGAAPTVDVGRDLTRGLRLKECSVALGPPSPLLNGHASPVPLKPSRSSRQSSQASPSQTIVNGCVGRRSQRSLPLLQIVTDKETNDGSPSTPATDHNLRSRKASSAQTPMTPSPPEQLPSPSPEKPSPPHLRSGTPSDKAVTRSDRMKSEDRGPSTRSSVERLAPQKFAQPEKTITTRSRERSIDPEAQKSSPGKNSDRNSRLHDRLRSRTKEESEEDDPPKRRRKDEVSDEPDGEREERRRRREERTACSSRVDDEQDRNDRARTSKDKWNTSHDRPQRPERSLRVKDRPYYEEPESEESPPTFPSRVTRTPKSVHRKKRMSSKSRVTKKRLSVEEKLIEDNKSYYKVEVLNSKLRSTEYFVNQKQAEERVNGDMAVEEVKPVVVRFKKIRTTELALLSDEAESFMFGEPKKEDSDEEDENSRSSSRVKEETTEGSSERHTSVKAETDSSSHSDLIPVRGPSSDDALRKVKDEEPDDDDDDEPIDEDVTKLTYAFEKLPAKEPWLDALLRQSEGTEYYIPMHHDYPKVVLPYQVKRRKRRTRKSASSPAAAPTPPTTMSVPSSPLHRKDRVSRLIQASTEEKPRKSPRRLTFKKGPIGSGPVASDVKSINCEESNEPEERCHASTLAIMSSLMRRRPHRECADKFISYEEESSLAETIESSGSNSNSMDVKLQPTGSEPCRLPPTGDLDLPPGGDRIAEALLNGLTHLDNYEPASCLGVDPSCINDDLPAPSQPGLDMSVDEILGTFPECNSMNLEENLYPLRPFPSFYRNQADSCASSDCSDFLGFMEDGQAATKKRKKRRNLTGWPIEKPRRKNRDTGGCLLSRPATPEPAHLTSAAATPHSASSPLRRRGRPPKIRPCLSATLAIPAADDPHTPPPHPSSPSDFSALPIKKKISRFGSRRAFFK